MTQDIFNILNYSPEFDHENLLLGIAHSWIMEHGEIKLLLTSKVQPDCISFIELDGAKHTIKEEK